MQIQKIFFSILMAFLSACQVKPTKVVSEEKLAKPAIKGAEILQRNPVILDVRPAFEFNLAHTPGAVNVRWEDFSQQSPSSRGVPLVDRFSMARRFSLIGVDLDTPVVVIGKGLSGMGEEGRVAWILKLLGVRDVTTLNATLLKDRSITRESPAIKNRPYWKPLESSFEAMMISRQDFKKAMTDPSVSILDVRGAQEVSLQSLRSRKDIKAAFHSLPWQDFFNDIGAPSEKVLETLKSKGLTAEANLIIISNHGVRSGAVTYSLQQLGWKRVRNFSGGYEQLGYGP